MKEAFRLVNFKKVYPLALLSTLLLYLGSFCLYRSNDGGVSLGLSVAGTLVSMVLFLYLYTAQAQVIANELTAEFQDEEPMSVREILANWKSYALPAVGVLVVAALMYQLVVPLIGSIAGGIFQVNILGFEVNVLTLLLNLALIVWTMFGIVEINALNVGFKDTFSYTVNFAFTNFRKVLLYLVVFVLLVYLVILLSFATLGMDYMIPVKILVTAYILGFLNAFASSLFIDNISGDDFVEPEEEEE